jgi:hypothetical protein
MSKGNYVIHTRLAPDVLENVMAAIVSANKTRRTEPYDLSSWVRAAIQAKLDHTRRAKRKPKPKETTNDQLETIPGTSHELDRIENGRTTQDGTG